MGLGRAADVAVSALEMQRARMELIASNLANARTTRTAAGGPYARRLPVVRAVPVGRSPFDDELARVVRGVRVVSVERDTRPPVLRYEPSHPDADARGYVAYPAIDPAEEMVDMMSAVRSYEANINVLASIRRMHEDAMRLVRG